MPTPGEQLRAAREARKLTLQQVVQATRIRSYYIEAMEADDLSVMPSAVQARGFLRAYSTFLGLDFEALTQPAEKPVAEPEPEPPAPPQPEPEPEPEPEAPSTPEPATEVPGREEQAPLALQPSDIIFRQIGMNLRQRRELLGLTLEEIERHTRVRRANLERIEQGEFDSLPSPVHARGMLSTYAGFLDMNPDAMLLRFAEGLQARHSERQPGPVSAPRRKPALPAWLTRLVSPDLIFGAIMVIGFSVLALWGAARIIASQEAEQEVEAPSISEVLLATSEVTETAQAIPTSLEELGTPLPSLLDTAVPPADATSPLPGSILQVTLIVRERVFLRVIVDGVVKQDGRVAPGAALVFDGRERIEVLTGNGNAVQVIYNQFDFGPLGNPGQVVNRIYTLEGVQTPTPTITPTATNTPRFQPSETPTITGTPPIPTGAP
jgi:cytoskeletal protein RodZ